MSDLACKRYVKTSDCNCSPLAILSRNRRRKLEMEREAFDPSWAGPHDLQCEHDVVEAVVILAFRDLQLCLRVFAPSFC